MRSRVLMQNLPVPCSLDTCGWWSAVFGWLVTALCDVVHLIDCGHWHCFGWMVNALYEVVHLLGPSTPMDGGRQCLVDWSLLCVVWFIWLTVATALCDVVHLIDCGYCFVCCGSFDWLWSLLCVMFIVLTMVTALRDVVHLIDCGHALCEVPAAASATSGASQDPWGLCPQRPPCWVWVHRWSSIHFSIWTVSTLFCII